MKRTSQSERFKIERRQKNAEISPLLTPLRQMGHAVPTFNKMEKTWTDRPLLTRGFDKLFATPRRVKTGHTVQLIFFYEKWN